MIAFFEQVGLGGNAFFKLICQAMHKGAVSVTGATTLGEAFLTSRGIRQGCPASPILFCLILMGLQRRLQRLQLEGGVLLGDQLVTST